MSATDKQKLRARFLKLRSQKSQAEITAGSVRIAEQLEKFFNTRSGGRWAAYRSIPKEAMLEPSFALLAKKNIQLCFPRMIDPVQGTMEFFEIKNWEADFERHEWGMWEPKTTCQIVPKEAIRGAFIPLLAFDRHGTRLGKGKAFYDRYLEGFKGKKVGIALEWQYSAVDIPAEPHDIRLDAVVTEMTIHRFPDLTISPGS